MIKTIPFDDFCNISDPDHRYESMKKGVELLYDNNEFVSCATLISCFIDAIAAGDGKATKGKFAAFFEQYFPTLSDELNGTLGNKSGPEVFYDVFRNGLAHLHGPKSGFALARDNEVDGMYALEVQVDGVGKFIGINIDRLASDFLEMITNLKSKTA